MSAEARGKACVRDVSVCTCDTVLRVNLDLRGVRRTQQVGLVLAVDQLQNCLSRSVCQGRLRHIVTTLSLLEAKERHQ
eukprot:scaffold9778_cov72-Phaeocystis_antarctica.AAC.5